MILIIDIYFMHHFLKNVYISDILYNQSTKIVYKYKTLFITFIYAYIVFLYRLCMFIYFIF